MPGSPGGDDQSLATGDNDNSTLADMDIGSEGGEHSPNRRKKKKNKRHTTRGGTSVLSGTQTGKLLLFALFFCDWILQCCFVFVKSVWALFAGVCYNLSLPYTLHILFLLLFFLCLLLTSF